MSETLFLENTEIIVFRVGNITIGLPISEVREIFKSPAMTPVRTAFSYVNGVINLRGNIVTIVDLSKRMNVLVNHNSKALHIVLVEFGEELIGLLVNSIDDSVFASRAGFFPVPANVNGADSHFFRALYQREEDLVAILDLDNTLCTETVE